MTVIVDITMPGKPPGINEMYINVPGRGRALTSAARKWKKDIGAFAKLNALETYAEHVSDNLRLEIIWFWPGVYRRDIDGPVKLVQDAICEALGYNDRRITELYVIKAQDTEEHFAVLLKAI